MKNQDILSMTSGEKKIIINEKYSKHLLIETVLTLILFKLNKVFEILFRDI